MMICILDFILFQISPPSHTCPFAKGAHAFLYVMILFLMRLWSNLPYLTNLNANKHRAGKNPIFFH
jgi:hypothetical protein